MTEKLPTVQVVGTVVACMHRNGRDQLLLRADTPRHAEYQAFILRGLLADAYRAGADSCLSTQEQEVPHNG